MATVVFCGMFFNKLIVGKQLYKLYVEIIYRSAFIIFFYINNDRCTRVDVNGRNYDLDAKNLKVLTCVRTLASRKYVQSLVCCCYCCCEYFFIFTGIYMYERTYVYNTVNIQYIVEMYLLSVGY